MYQLTEDDRKLLISAKKQLKRRLANGQSVAGLCTVIVNSRTKAPREDILSAIQLSIAPHAFVSQWLQVKHRSVYDQLRLEHGGFVPMMHNYRIAWIDHMLEVGAI